MKQNWLQVYICLQELVSIYICSTSVRENLITALYADLEESVMKQTKNTTTPSIGNSISSLVFGAQITEGVQESRQTDYYIEEKLQQRTQMRRTADLQRWSERLDNDVKKYYDEVYTMKSTVLKINL